MQSWGTGSCSVSPFSSRPQREWVAPARMGGLGATDRLMFIPCASYHPRSRRFHVQYRPQWSSIAGREGAGRAGGCGEGGCVLVSPPFLLPFLTTFSCLEHFCLLPVLC